MSKLTLTPCSIPPAEEEKNRNWAKVKAAAKNGEEKCNSYRGFECQRLRKNCRCLLCTVPYHSNPTGLQEEGKNCEGLPDTNIVFNGKRVDHNPTKSKTKKFLKVGKMAVKTLKSVRESIPELRKDLVNKSRNYI